MPIETVTNYDYLIDRLRLHLGDTTVGSYTYTDNWLRTSLASGIIALTRWWRSKYTLDSDYNVVRNTATWDTFETASPPEIQYVDERPIILMASITIKSGSLEASSWNFGYWKDNEISYSNIEGAKQKDRSIVRDWRELNDMLTVPGKKLRNSLKGSLPGFLKNPHESKIDY